ncbi:MAG: beta-ketoacyl-ACP synthase III [Anaerolineae bacterium]
MAVRNTPNGISPTGIYAHIIGWGMSVPDNIMTNDDLAAIVETDNEWIVSRTGIHERRIATEKDSTVTLAHSAAQKALEEANVLPQDIDLIVVATSTPEHVFPSTASVVQDWLGASNAGAFDLAAACSGFVYALNMAADSIKSGSIDTAVVIGAETMSRVLDWQDRSTCILFGDGAGAVVLQASEEHGGILSSVLRSDGAGADLLAIPTTNNPHLAGHKAQKMHMAGREVFRFATRVVDSSIREAVELAGIKMSDVNLVVPHQANQRILASAAKKLGLHIDKFVSNLDRYGNTSAASIPIALCEATESDRVQRGDHLVFVGFGGGLSWASMVIKWIPDAVRVNRNIRLNQQRREFQYQWARWRSRFQRWRRRLNRWFGNGTE